MSRTITQETLLVGSAGRCVHVLPTAGDLARQLGAVVADLPRFVVPLRRRRHQTWGADSLTTTYGGRSVRPLISRSRSFSLRNELPVLVQRSI
jgi:hypothetical protein